jgi:hypothetical protein
VHVVVQNFLVSDSFLLPYALKTSASACGGVIRRLRAATKTAISDARSRAILSSLMDLSVALANL